MENETSKQLYINHWISGAHKGGGGGLFGVKRPPKQPEPKFKEHYFCRYDNIEVFMINR